MKDTAKMLALTTSGFVVRILIGVLFATFLFFILQLYMQNRLNGLYDTRHTLSRQMILLQRDALLLQQEINLRTSLKKLSGFADSAGLELNAVPFKVMVQEGRNE